jgi:DNA-binding CsgD family transcriptional regulator
MTTSELYAADVERLVRVLDDARQDDPSPAMPWALLEGLLRLIPSDLDVSYQHHDHRALHNVCIQRVWDGGLHEGPAPHEGGGPDHPFWQYWWHGLSSWPQRTGDLRTVIHTGDFFATERQRLADPGSDLNPEVHAAMIVSLPAPPGEARRVCFMRHSGPSFSERERQLAVLFRPHLQEIWLDAERRRAGVPRLTDREWEVLAMAATGVAYADIAQRLFISVGTVRKHMEHVRDRLGVHSVGAAAAVAMPHAPAHVRDAVRRGAARSTARAPAARGPTGGR